jgi:AcrR family transcriptional regulator
MMAALDAEMIILATEDVLRRYGPSKATVVDVARALGVSHAAVYRHFPSKAALREAVTRRWLGRVYDGLGGLATDARRDPPERLRGWLIELFQAKRRAATTDPELFATYRVLAGESSAVAAEHVVVLLGQLEAILADGFASGDFAGTDSAATARVVFEATSSFHHPAHVTEWQLPDRDELLADLCICALTVKILCIILMARRVDHECDLSGQRPGHPPGRGGRGGSRWRRSASSQGRHEPRDDAGEQT